MFRKMAIATYNLIIGLVGGIVGALLNLRAINFSEAEFAIQLACWSVGGLILGLFIDVAISIRRRRVKESQ